MAANYGRTDNVTCPLVGQPKTMVKTDCYSDQIKSFNTICNGKNSCTVPSSNAKFGDPCVGTYKYTGIIFFYYNYFIKHSIKLNIYLDVSYTCS